MKIFDLINNTVSKVFDVSVEDMVSENKHREVSEARYAAYYIAYKEFKFSQKKIGSEYHQKLPSTISAGLSRCDELIEEGGFWAHCLKKSWDIVKEKAYE